MEFRIADTLPSSMGMAWCQVMRMPSRISLRVATSGVGHVAVSLSAQYNSTAARRGT